MGHLLLCVSGSTFSGQTARALTSASAVTSANVFLSVLAFTTATASAISSSVNSVFPSADASLIVSDSTYANITASVAVWTSSQSSISFIVFATVFSSRQAIVSTGVSTSASFHIVHCDAKCLFLLRSLLITILVRSSATVSARASTRSLPSLLPVFA